MRMSSVCLLLVLLPLLAHVVEGSESKCGEGWIYHDERCYIFKNEYEIFSTATQTCEMLGGGMAFAYDQKSLDFLIVRIKSKSNYAWWYGITYDSYVHQFSVVEIHELTNSIIRPKPKQLIEPTRGCIALLIGNVYYIDYIFIPTPCKVKLPYACRGEPSLISNSVLNDKDHTVVASSSDVYWFSHVLDKRTYEDAQKACSEKSMTLISIRDNTASENITSEIYSRQDNSVDPWWIGLSVTEGDYSWTSGVELRSSVLQWKRLPSEYQFHPNCRILLEEGTMDDRDCFFTRAPFICARRALLTGRFGCPPYWIRAGQSCYYYGKSNYTWISHSKAHDLCAKFDSHLVSIDTLEEKIWLLESSVFKTNNYRHVWTSLNDKKSLNDFRWADGSKPSRGFVDINPGRYTLGNGKCFGFSPYYKDLSKSECEYNAFPGCQYKSHNGRCISDYWKFLNGNCYYVVNYDNDNDNDSTSKYNTDAGPYHSMLKKCYSDVVQYDSSITVRPLKLDSQAVIDLFPAKYYVYIFTGLVETDKGVYKWADGSTADMSLFNTTAKRKDTSTKRCVAMNEEGQFILWECDSMSPRALCEKEIPYHHTG